MIYAKMLANSVRQQQQNETINKKTVMLDVCTYKKESSLITGPDLLVHLVRI